MGFIVCPAYKQEEVDNVRTTVMKVTVALSLTVISVLDILFWLRSPARGDNTTSDYSTATRGHLDCFPQALYYLFVT